MAMWPRSMPASRGYALVADELATKRQRLKDRQADLDKAQRHVAELAQTCGRLKSDIEELEHDQRALDRGYIALMGDAQRQAS